MNQARLLQILRTPHISEKALRVADNQRQFVFKVMPNATKPEIKQAVELLFNVKVEQVQTLRVQGKSKNFSRTKGKRADWKKAYVKLQTGFDINFRGNQ